LPTLLSAYVRAGYQGTQPPDSSASHDARLELSMIVSGQPLTLSCPLRPGEERTVTSAERSATAGAPVVDSQLGVGAVVAPAATASTRGGAEAGQESWVHAQLDACARSFVARHAIESGAGCEGDQACVASRLRDLLLRGRWLHVREDGSIDPGAGASWGASGSDDLDLDET
jgi:hypothetical protein